MWTLGPAAPTFRRTGPSVQPPTPAIDTAPASPRESTRRASERDRPEGSGRSSGPRRGAVCPAHRRRALRSCPDRSIPRKGGRKGRGRRLFGDRGAEEHPPVAHPHRERDATQLVRHRRGVGIAARGVRLEGAAENGADLRRELQLEERWRDESLAGVLERLGVVTSALNRGPMSISRKRIPSENTSLRASPTPP